jgi:hypothetical protein
MPIAFKAETGFTGWALSVCQPRAPSLDIFSRVKHERALVYVRISLEGRERAASFLSQPLPGRWRGTEIVDEVREKLRLGKDCTGPRDEYQRGWQ